MDLYVWLTFLTILIAVPSAAISILQLIEWRKKYKDSKGKPK